VPGDADKDWLAVLRGVTVDETHTIVSRADAAALAARLGLVPALLDEPVHSSAGLKSVEVDGSSHHGW
jgi:hypothetical protein